MEICAAFIDSRPNEDITVNISELDIKRMETGHKRISSEYLYHLSKILGVTVEAFFLTTTQKIELSDERRLRGFASAIEVNKLIGNFMRIRAPEKRALLIEQALAFSQPAN